MKTWYKYYFFKTLYTAHLIQKVGHRYQRGRRLLTENLSSGNAVGNSSEQQRDGNAAMDDDDYEVPDLIEEIIGE